jgi:hypothetical protein
MRMFVYLCLIALASPLSAWEFTPFPICTLARTADPQVTVTYDGATYALHITRPEGWPPADVFSLRFAPNGPTISTTRHSIDGNRLTVTDSGFGNVLNGLQFNTTAIALIGNIQQPIDLQGAAPAVEAFRNCRPAPSA